VSPYILCGSKAAHVVLTDLLWVTIDTHTEWVRHWQDIATW